MLYYTIVFLMISLVAGLCGFFALAGASMEIARVLFMIFIVLLVASLAAQVFVGSRAR